MKRIIQIAKRALSLFAWLLVSPIIMAIPRNHHKIVFGAWGGKQFSCNPKYLFKYMTAHKEFSCVWVGESHLQRMVMALPGAHFARKGSLTALWHCLTARFYVCNVNWREDIINLPRCRRVKLIYTTHGYADKNVGVKQFSGNGAVVDKGKTLQSLRNLLNRIEDWLYGFQSWCSESSEQGVSIRLSNQPFIMSPERMLRFGKPRADYLITNRRNLDEKVAQKRKIAEILGLPQGKRWYLYVPTWRHDDSKVFSFTRAKRKSDIVDVLKQEDAIIIEKQHPIVLGRCKLPFGFVDDIAVLTAEQSRMIDTQELLMASDRLITDYSSIYYDFVLLERPVIHFAYDYDDFMSREMGFNYDMRNYGGGPFTYDEVGLISYLRKSDSDLLLMRNEATRRDQLTFETGEACAHYCEFFKAQS